MSKLFDFAHLRESGTIRGTVPIALLVWPRNYNQAGSRERLLQRLASVSNRLDRAYLDKLDGKISQELWCRKSGEWQTEEQPIQMAFT